MEQAVSSNRREFLRDLPTATAGMLFVGCSLLDNAFGNIEPQAAPQPGGKTARREILIGGRRVKTIDVHCHCSVSGAWDLLKGLDGAKNVADPRNGPEQRRLNTENVTERLAEMDEHGIDVQAISINPFWYWAERDPARQLIQMQNEKIAEICAAHPDRFVGMGTLALQHPDLAAEQLEQGVKKLGMRGFLIAGSVNGKELSSPEFHPFWSKAEELGTLIFIHPQEFVEGGRRFQGNGHLRNVIGLPLETTVALSHLIFEGTLDRFPGLKVCAAHGGGFLPSYSGRSDQCLKTFPALCKPVAKNPSEYLKQLYFDSIVITSEGLRHLIATAGVSQIVLGTDYPFGWNDDGVDRILGTPGLSDADRIAILGGNLANLLQIEM